MSAKGKQSLVIRLSGSEVKLLRLAALVEDGEVDQLAAWAKETLLESARSRAEVQSSPRGGSPKATRPRPKCGCGATGSPGGECDGSCIMRF